MSLELLTKEPQMSADTLKFEVDHSIRIMKPAAVVFEAIASPEHLNRYFTAKSTGRLEAGRTVEWEWKDWPEKVPVEVVESVPPVKLVFKWSTHDHRHKTTVQFDLEDQKEKGTIVRVREGQWISDSKGLKNSYENSGGWMHMLCCLKAYLDFEVDLRSKPMPENWN